MTNSSLTKDECEQLRMELRETSSAMSKLHNRLFKVRQYLTQLEGEYSRLQKRYQEVDYKLALNDERFKVVETKKPASVRRLPQTTKTETLVDKLTPEQIEKLASELGIKVTLQRKK